MRSVLKRIYAAIPGKRHLFKALRFLPLPPSVYRHLHFHGMFAVTIPETGRRWARRCV